jgi:tetratricopeptide (TPR) repeat protein
MTVGRKILMSLVVTAFFFLLVEGILALVGVRPEGYASDPYLGFSSTSRLFVDDGAGGLETSDAKITLFNQQSFPADASGAFRIFCVGGSTTFGRPYDDTTSFCGWLRELLPVADPTRKWDVVNAGGVSYASYRVALVMEELIDYDPDLFIVYTGHNEFLEKRSYPEIIAMPRMVRGVGGIASKTRIWTAMSGVLTRDPGSRSTPESSPDLLEEEVTTLLDGAVGPSAYTRDDGLAEKVLQHYRFNLARMVDIAASAGAATVFVTPASNLQDSRPFKSEHRTGLTASETERFNAAVDAARQLRANGAMEGAIEKIFEAAAIDSRPAQLAFLQGRLLLESGRLEEARSAFERARDEDVCPLRALGPMAGIVREVAAAAGSPLVDFEVLADGWAADSIPGQDLFFDHVHPRIDVHRRLAVEIIEAMARAGFASLSPDWNNDAVAAVAQRVEASLDPLTHALALMKLSKVLGWAGKLQESYGLAVQAVEMFPDDSRVQYNAGLTAHLIGRKNDAVEHYRRAVEIQPDADEPHGNLGVLLEEAGRLDDAIDHFRMAIRYARSPETARRNSVNLARALTASGTADYRQGRQQEALAKLTEAAEIGPDNPEILGRLGIAQLAAGRSADAVSTFETALVSSPNSPVLLNRLALALALDGRVDRAATTYSQALALDPKVRELPDNLFRVLGNMGRTDLANDLHARVGE